MQNTSFSAILRLIFALKENIDPHWHAKYIYFDFGLGRVIGNENQSKPGSRPLFLFFGLHLFPGTKIATILGEDLFFAWSTPPKQPPPLQIPVHATDWHNDM